MYAWNLDPKKTQQYNNIVLPVCDLQLQVDTLPLDADLI